MTRNLELFANSPLERLIEEHPSILLRIDETPASVRTLNSLLSEDILYVGDLIQNTEKSLLRIPNFGRKSLKELTDMLGYIQLSLGSDLPNWPPTDIDFLRQKFSRKIDKEKERQYTLSHQETASSLEEELFNFANVKGDRNAQIFIQRMGWDGNGGMTLDAVGKKYGMTRERVRQICEKIEKNIRLTKPPIKFLRKAIHHVSSRLPSPASEIENELVSSGISHKPFRIEGLLAAADFFGLRAKFVIKKIGREKTKLAVPSKYSRYPNIIIQQARKHIEHWGAGTINDLTCVVNGKGGPPIDDEFTKMVLESQANFRWLDKDTGWFWLKNTKRNRVLSLVKKVLAVSEKVHISDLREGIRRPHRMSGYSPPRKALLELCRQSEGYQVTGDMVIAVPPLNWEEIISPTQWVIACALKEYGPVMKRSDLEALCLDIGMNRSSFYIYLDYVPFVQRFARGVYGLRGADISASEIGRLADDVGRDYRIANKALGEKKVLLDYGWSGDGKIWIGYKLSESSIFNGVVTTPGSMQTYIAGEFSLYSIDGTCMGTLKSGKGNSWGLGPFFRRRGGEPGDFMVLLYDLRSKKTIVELGDEALIERFASSGERIDQSI